MKAPRDMARAQSRARPLARFAAPAVPALASEAALRDLSDLTVWEDSIRRSRMRRDAAESQLNFGPVTGKRLAVPMAMLAAGLLVRDAASGDRSGSASGVAHADRASATTAAPAGTARHRGRAKPAATPSQHAAASRAPSKPAAPGKRVRPAKTRVGDELTRGDHGAAVSFLQRALGVPADGYYGPHTLQAVHQLQKRRHLTVDGRVGPATWRALRSNGPTAKPHRSASGQRAHGHGVRAVQQALGVSADGVFGKQTAHAVRAFQAKHGLKADGVVGPATWSALGVPNAHGVLRRHHTVKHHGGANRAHTRHHAPVRIQRHSGT